MSLCRKRGGRREKEEGKEGEGRKERRGKGKNGLKRKCAEQQRLEYGGWRGGDSSLTRRQASSLVLQPYQEGQEPLEFKDKCLSETLKLHRVSPKKPLPLLTP